MVPTMNYITDQMQTTLLKPNASFWKPLCNNVSESINKCKTTNKLNSYIKNVLKLRPKHGQV